jgi:hypothetical protein
MARLALQGAFGMMREVLVNVYHREETIECLTRQAGKDPLRARETDERMYEKLRRIGTLTYLERRALSQVMSANRRAMGNLLLKSGRRKEARDCYKRALLMHTSMRSLGKFLLGFAPFRFS